VNGYLRDRNFILSLVIALLILLSLLLWIWGYSPPDVIKKISESS
jgi:hypothetical protein